MLCGVWRYGLEALTVWPLLLISHKHGSGFKLEAMLYFFFFRKQRGIGVDMKNEKKKTLAYCLIPTALYFVRFLE